MNVVSVCKKESLFDLKKSTRILTNEKIAKAWSATKGDIYNANSYSNFDKYDYFYAVLGDGTAIPCDTKVFDAAYSLHSYYITKGESNIGTKELPSNWIEIRYCRYRYQSCDDRFKQPMYPESHDKTKSGVVVARNNLDGTVTVYKTI